MTSDNQDNPINSRCGFAVLVGAVNAGKSTLINALVGEKISIVTHKVQTTRMDVHGLAILGDSQVVIVDTPGIFPDALKPSKHIKHNIWSDLSSANIVAVIIDAANRNSASTPQLLNLLRQKLGGSDQGSDLAKFLILNKIDRCAKGHLLEVARKANDLFYFDKTFMISALHKRGVNDVLAAMASCLPRSPWLYPSQQVATLSLRQMASEITREKLMLRLHDEIPYCLTVETTGWQNNDKDLRIDQTIFVERSSQQAIVLGKNGQTIKAIGIAARKELVEIYAKKVHLFLKVKVEGNVHQAKQRQN